MVRRRPFPYVQSTYDEVYGTTFRAAVCHRGLRPTVCGVHAMARDPYHRVPLGRQRAVGLTLHNYAGFSIDFQHRSLPSVTELPKTGRAHYGPPTQQPS